MKRRPEAQTVDRARLLALVPRLRDVKIVVVGDLFLDEYVLGRATRLSREAPVPVLEFEREFDLPGAAANPANNIRALGGRAVVIGVVGADDKASRLRGHLAAAGLDVAGVIADPSRPTITKSRVVAEDGTRIRQQIVRVDRLDRRPLAAAIAEQLAAHLLRSGADAHAILLSDYKTGVICPEVIEAGRALATGGRLVAVDSQGDLLSFRGLSLVKVNQQEAEAALRCSLDDDAACTTACGYLLDQLDASVIVVTRGIDGMSVASREIYAHIPAANRSEVFDVTGAGDTVIAVLTQALAAGATLLESSCLANLAAGLVVRKLGNATTSPEELREAIAGATVGINVWI